MRRACSRRTNLPRAGSRRLNASFDVRRYGCMRRYCARAKMVAHGLLHLNPRGASGRDLEKHGRTTTASSASAASTTNGWHRRRWRITRRATRRQRARKSSFRVGNTALGPIAFLACEAIGGTITIAYGFPNALSAIVAFIDADVSDRLADRLLRAKYGVDIDLLHPRCGLRLLSVRRITSLIYASFTFLLFAIEASILSDGAHHAVRYSLMRPRTW